MRRWLAKRLCPEVFETELRYHSIMRDISEAYWWLDDRQGREVAVWLNDSHRDKWRSEGEQPKLAYPAGIGPFREYLRRIYPL